MVSHQCVTDRQTGLVKQGRPRSDCSWMSSLIRIYTVYHFACFEGKNPLHSDFRITSIFRVGFLKHTCTSKSQTYGRSPDEVSALLLSCFPQTSKTCGFSSVWDKQVWANSVDPDQGLHCLSFRLHFLGVKPQC